MRIGTVGYRDAHFEQLPQKFGVLIPEFFSGFRDAEEIRIAIRSIEPVSSVKYLRGE